MVELTVANVAGLIAAGCFIAGRLFKDGLALVVSYNLGDKASASTWTVASAALQKSLWPVLLRTDIVYNNGVQARVLWLYRLFTATSVLLSAAAIVTPLGLYSVLLLGDYETGHFVYARDPSPFGYGTSARSNLSWARECGAGRSLIDPPRPCPFSDTVVIVQSFPNGTESVNLPYSYNMSVPDILLETYSSGTKEATTVSNFFDIEYRRTTAVTNSFYMNNTAFLEPANRGIESLVQDNAIKLVEGLVVDVKNGSIGFRNHTVPVGYPHGVRWTEDLLFLEPETVCVDINLTLDYTISNDNESTTSGYFLTDRGGFVSLNRTYPRLDVSDPQAMPNIRVRAYRAAWLHNAYAALYLNLTNPNNGSQTAFSYMTSELGQQFRMSVSGSDANGISDADALEIGQSFGNWLKPAQDPDNPGMTANPWQISNTNWSSINIACSDSAGTIYANISNILIACGQMRGVPQRVDGGSSVSFDRGSVWSQKIFTCASAVKATVKTTTFEYTGNGDLDGLVAVDLVDKEYPDTASMPLWGVEDSDGSYLTTDIQLLWGIVDDSYVGRPNISTVQKPSLYLPGNMGITDNLGLAWGDWENLPGSDFAHGALSASYQIGGAGSSAVIGLNPTINGVDYTGKVSLAMWARWQNLTSRDDSASIIPNLLFADLAASMVVGTKGVLGPGNTGNTAAAVRVQPIVSTVRYHVLFGIPAFIVAFLLVLLLVGIVLCAILPGLGRRRGIGSLRAHIQGLASGRIYTIAEYPGLIDSTTNAKSWNQSFGKMEISLTTKPKEEGQLLRHDEEIVHAK